MARGRKTGGRQRGTPNKATAEIREVTAGLFDDVYWANAKRRLASGRMAPAVEAKLLAYRYGEPKQTYEHTGPDGGPIQFHDHFSLPAHA